MTDTQIPMEIEVVTRRDLATIITEDVQRDDLAAFVEGLPLPRIPTAVLRLREIRTTLKQLEDALETRWGLECGLSFKDPQSEKWYDFTAASRGGFGDVPGLVSDLLQAGMTTAEIARAVKDLRVTDLEAAADEHRGAVRVCTACGTVFAASGQIPIPQHGVGPSCDAGPEQLEDRPTAEFLRAIIRDYRTYKSGPPHFTEREERARGRGRKQIAEGEKA